MDFNLHLDSIADKKPLFYFYCFIHCFYFAYCFIHCFLRNWVSQFLIKWFLICQTLLYPNKKSTGLLKITSELFQLGKSDGTKVFNSEASTWWHRPIMRSNSGVVFESCWLNAIWLVSVELGMSRDTISFVKLISVKRFVAPFLICWYFPSRIESKVRK